VLELTQEGKLHLGESEAETEQKPISNPNPVERRNSLFTYLGRAIRLSYEKMSSRGNSDSQNNQIKSLQPLIA